VRYEAAFGKPNLALLLETEDHVPLFATSTYDCGITPPEAVPGEEYFFSVTFTMLFRPGRVYATPWLGPAHTADPTDRRPRMCSAVITATHDFGGIVNLPHTGDYSPATTAVPSRSR
jgi:hypothetical protein